MGRGYTARLYSEAVQRGCTARLYRGIGVIPKDYREAYRNRGTSYNRGLFYNVYL